MKIRIAFVLMASLLTLSSLGSELECRVEYTYKKGTNLDGTNPSGIGQPMTDYDEFVIYKKCKEFCYVKNANNYPHISSVAGCYVNEVPLENSKYKTLYNKNKNNICHITAYKNGKKHGGDYLDLTRNEISCQQSMATKYWCQQGYSCKYTYGKW